jgi:hypothetical protein
MMLKVAKLGIAMAVLAVLIVPAAYAGVPSQTLSYFVPQSGSVTTPTEGTLAIRNARRCPNDDGTQVFPLNARLKVVVLASDGSPISGIAASDVCIMFNGGTGVGTGLQGFTGVGDDSIIANFQYNQLANCPDVRCVQADAPTDVNGVTYITWIGATPGQPGVGTRDPFRKWGGFAGDIPLYVLGFKLQGKLTSSSPLGSYTAHVKSLDFVGGRTTSPNAGELVNALDINPVHASVGSPAYLSGDLFHYEQDFDNNGIVNAIDLNFITVHVNHRCNFPNAN